MDFHSLTRKQLQTLCKKNKVPANLTNVAMADALKALEIVEGMEDFLQPSQSETAKSSLESPEKMEVTSPIVPRTGCRTSTRRKVVKDESVASQTLTRTRRGTARRAAEEVEEVNNDVAETLTVAQSSQRRAPVATACHKMEIQLNECIEGYEKNEGQLSHRKKAAPKTPAAAPTRSTLGKVLAASACQKKDVIGTPAIEQSGYGTRRSTRLFEKKMAEASLEEKEVIAPVKIVSFSIEENLAVEEIEEDLGKVIEETEMCGMGLQTTSDEPLDGTNASTDHSGKKLDMILENGTASKGNDQVDIYEDGDVEAIREVYDHTNKYSNKLMFEDDKECEDKICTEDKGTDDVFHPDTGISNDEKEICSGDNVMEALDSVTVKSGVNMDFSVENINEDDVEGVIVVSEDSDSVNMINKFLDSKGTNDCALNMLTENPDEPFKLDFENSAASDGCSDAVDSAEESVVNDLTNEGQGEDESENNCAVQDLISVVDQEHNDGPEMAGKVSIGKVFNDDYITSLDIKEVPITHEAPEFEKPSEDVHADDPIFPCSIMLDEGLESREVFTEELETEESVVNDWTNEDQGEDESENNCAVQDLISVVDQEHNDGPEMAGQVSIGKDFNYDHITSLDLKEVPIIHEALDFKKPSEDVHADDPVFPCSIMLDEGLESDEVFTEELEVQVLVDSSKKGTIMNNVVDSCAKELLDMGSEVRTDNFPPLDNTLGTFHMVSDAVGPVSGSCLVADPCQTYFNLMASGLSPTKRASCKTPVKKSLSKTTTTIRRLPYVLDDKENIDNSERKLMLTKDKEIRSKKDRAEDDLNNLSLRKLTKMVKELSISENLKTEVKSNKVAKERSPLRTLPQNGAAVVEEE